MNQYILRFGGFYESIHSDRVESIICEKYNVDSIEELDDETFYNIDYKPYEINYLNEYIEELNKMLDTNFSFVNIISPREYNYYTDYAVVETNEEPEEIRKKLTEFISINNFSEDFDSRIKILTKSCSGYIPYYDYKEVLENDKLYIEFALEFICRIKEIY